MGLVGQRTGRRWQMGDTVRVRLSRVDLTQRQIDFELLDADGCGQPRHGAAHRARGRRIRPRDRRQRTGEAAAATARRRRRARRGGRG